MVYLQLKLCDPCLSTLRIYIEYKRRYINTLPFRPFLTGRSNRNIGRCCVSKLLCLSTVAVGRSFSDDNAIVTYTSGFADNVMFSRNGPYSA